MKDELFTVAQAAEYLKVCDKTVRRMIASKELVASKVGSRSWRIRKDDISHRFLLCRIVTNMRLNICL